jgi:hypothetical protein
MKLMLAIPVLITGVSLASGDAALASGNTTYGVPTPPGPFVNPAAGSLLPGPRNVPGKEYSTQFDLDAANSNTPGQSLFWDGLGGTRNAARYSDTRQLDALANQSDALFDAVRRNAANLLISIQGDFGGKSIYAIDPAGKISIWADNSTIKTPPPSAFDLDALEIWGADLVVNANVYSLEADVLPDGLSSASVIRRKANGSVEVMFNQNDIANAIGRPDLADVIDLDALMVSDNKLLFSIRPVGEFDGGEIWDWSGSGSASFLSFGGVTWDTNFGIQQYFANQGFQVRSENIDALEAASTVPGPLPVLGASAAFGWSRRLRKRLRQAGQLAAAGHAGS